MCLTIKDTIVAKIFVVLAVGYVSVRNNENCGQLRGAQNGLRKAESFLFSKMKGFFTAAA